MRSGERIASCLLLGRMGAGILMMTSFNVADD